MGEHADAVADGVALPPHVVVGDFGGVGDGEDAGVEHGPAGGGAEAIEDGGISGEADVSWPRDNSRVWQLHATAGTAYVKVQPDLASYRRKVHAYEQVVHRLSDGRAPRLLASNPDLLAVLISAVPGRVVRDLPLEAVVERRVHQHAG
ncbi:hypothetical protein [Kitasatospora sp. NPDC002040]|uniref:hypothetical protein n=1 Tax=Kitasatospora sp. NPDC002040 TaxID=3154661 RepID=UPI003319577C